MAGRGKGGGLTLTRDQIQALGISRDKNPVLAPAPLFPKLENKPLPLPTDPAIEYMLIVKQQFHDHLCESPTFVKEQIKVEDDVERYSDKYKILSHDLKGSRTVPCVWSHIPTELRPGKSTQPRKRKAVIKKDIDTKLQKLEKLEMKEEEKSDTEETAQEGDELDDLDVADEEEYQIDEGTDYGHNYFDNGEGFEDEDDNMDDGPVY